MVFAKPFLLESSVQTVVGIQWSLLYQFIMSAENSFPSGRSGKVKVTRYAQLGDNSNNKRKQLRVFTDKLASITTICIETIIK